MSATMSFPEGVNFDLVARFSSVRGLSEPEDLTERLLFLASPRAKAVHGACFAADRGVTAG